MIVGIGTWRGSGATTTSLALAGTLAARGVPTWLVEADPAGGVLSARLRLDRSAADGLERIGFTSSTPVGGPSVGGTGVGRPSGSSTPVGGMGNGMGNGTGNGTGNDAAGFTAGNGAVGVDRFDAVSTTHHGVRLITTPGDPFRAWTSHRPRTPWAESLGQVVGTGVAIVDLGRLRGATPAGPLLEQLDVLLVLSHDDVISLATTLEWATVQGRVSPHDVGLRADVTRIVVTEHPGGCERVSRTAAEIELGDRYAGWLPWAPGAAAMVNTGAAVTARRLQRDPYLHAIEHLAEQCARWHPALARSA